ncbi:MAG: 30S ribosomal protein S5 [Firmicutes bacterium]|nr:30S ribosomal protein S5 [Bacillota bacterium]
MAVRRVTKVVKGGRNMRFSALVVVGDGAGMIGIGSGRANEVPSAIEKAVQEAKRKMQKVSLFDTTIPHNVIGKFGTSRVIMLPASRGTGVIAGGPVRAVMEAVGIKDIRTKCHGTNNPINVTRAVIDGLMQLRTKEEVAALRGKTVAELMGQKETGEVK